MKTAIIRSIIQAFALAFLWIAMGTKSVVECILLTAVAATFLTMHSPRLTRLIGVHAAMTFAILVVTYYLFMPESVADWVGLSVVSLLLVTILVYSWSSRVSSVVQDTLDSIDPTRKLRKRLALMYWPMLLVFAVFLLVYSFQHAEPVAR